MTFCPEYKCFCCRIFEYNVKDATFSVDDTDQVDNSITAKWNKLPIIPYIALIVCAEWLYWQYIHSWCTLKSRGEFTTICYILTLLFAATTQHFVPCPRKLAKQQRPADAEAKPDYLRQPLHGWCGLYLVSVDGHQWLDEGWASCREQNTIWANVDQLYWRIYASSYLNEIMV